MNVRSISQLLCLLAILAIPRTAFSQVEPIKMPEGPIRFEDVSFMLRGAVPESEILKEVKRRKLRAPLTVLQENSLHSSNASAAFLTALKSPEYNLPMQTIQALDKQDMQAQEARIAAYDQQLMSQALASKAGDETQLTKKRLGVDVLEETVAGQRRIIENQELRIRRLEALISAPNK